jgi:hypothetical protein
MKFTNHLFISYAHIDNERIVKASIGLQDSPFLSTSFSAIMVKSQHTPYAI